MTSLERALADYRRRINLRTLDKLPVIWAKHYSSDGEGREIAAPAPPDIEDGLGRAVLTLMAPFANSPEVQSSWLVIDTTRVPGVLNLSRILVVATLVATEKGVYNGNWKVNAEGFVHPGFFEIPDVNRALSAVSDQRLAGPTLSFDDAFWGAVSVGRDLYA